MIFKSVFNVFGGYALKLRYYNFDFESQCWVLLTVRLTLPGLTVWKWLTVENILLEI